MDVKIFDTKDSMAREASAFGAEAIRNAIVAAGEANVILATGASQFEMLDHLVARTDIDWSRVTVFHLDEYVGMPESHPASFRKYLRERFVQRVPALAAFHPLGGDAADPAAESRRVGALLLRHPIDVAFVGIGENGHLAFNDPPADFDTTEPYLVVDLDRKCREQQLGEGWFPSLEDVPRQAISMSVRQIMKSRRIVTTVPDRRKAEAVRCTVEGPVSNQCPASILQNHSDCGLFLDRESASLLSERR